MIEVSVVVPTYNRREVLKRTVRCLLEQTGTVADYEVIVVDDQSTDGTAAWLQTAQAGLPRLTAVTSPRKGRAQARNAGLAVARGEVVCFVDDDVWVVPGFVCAHWEAHAAGEPKMVAIGRLDTCPDTCPTVANAYEDARLMRVEHRLATAGDGLGPGSFRTGNVSVRRAFLAEVGGFDEGFHGYSYEDSELGCRLLAHGGRFRYVPQAAGCHFTQVTVPEILRKRREAGVSAVTFLRRQPEVSASIPAPFAVPGVPTTARHDPLPKRLAKALAVSPPTGWLLGGLVGLLSRTGWRGACFPLLQVLEYHHYARAYRRAAQATQELPPR